MKKPLVFLLACSLGMNVLLFYKWMQSLYPEGPLAQVSAYLGILELPSPDGQWVVGMRYADFSWKPREMTLLIRKSEEDEDVMEITVPIYGELQKTDWSTPTTFSLQTSRYNVIIEPKQAEPGR